MHICVPIPPFTSTHTYIITMCIFFVHYGFGLKPLLFVKVVLIVVFLFLVCGVFGVYYCRGLFFFYFVWGWFVAKAFGGLGVTAGLAADRTGMTGMVAGQQFFETDTKLLYMYSGSDWILIDNLTLNYTPSFWAYRPSTQAGSQATVVFTATRQNIGTHYNTSNGLFTAPINGTYKFDFQTIMNSSAGQTGSGGYKFIYNGSVLSGPTTYSNVSAWNVHAMGICVYMTSGQTMGVYAYEPGMSYTYGDSGNIHNCFTGALISYR